MRIALVSFEYPPDTSFGGIATYVGQVAKVLHNRGHDVEVFTATGLEKTRDIVEGIVINYISNLDREKFKDLVLPVFSASQEKKPFDIVESPEYGADGLRIKEKYPRLPLTVKLHTPSYLIDEMNGNLYKPHWFMRLRILTAGYRRFKKPNRTWKYEKKNDNEYKLAKLADLLTTPSVSLGDIVSAKWKIARKRITDLPYPFIPSKALLEIPVNTNLKIITYFGRLEIRKGVLIFAKIIPVIAAKYPDYRFRFVGKDMPSQNPSFTVKTFLKTELNKYLDKIEFIDAIPQEQIPGILADTAICIFPSKWENFPNVCLESMSAGRAIIGSINGGMKDMLEMPKAGLLVNPLSAEQLIERTEKFIHDPSLRTNLGKQARKNILEKYSESAIGKMIEHHYNQVIR